MPIRHALNMTKSRATDAATVTNPTYSGFKLKKKVYYNIFVSTKTLNRNITLTKRYSRAEQLLLIVRQIKFNDCL